MPSKSKAQARFFQAVAHSKEFADKVDVPQSVGKEFAAADQQKKGRDRITRAIMQVRQR